MRGDRLAAMRYTLKQLGYFVAAGEHGSITGAAHAINVSQAAISAALGHLEAVLGCSFSSAVTPRACR